MAGYPSPVSQDSIRGVNAMDIVGLGFWPYEDYRRAIRSGGGGLVGIEVNFAGGCAR